MFVQSSKLCYSVCVLVAENSSAKISEKKTCHLMTFNNDIVDGRNPAPPEM